MFVVGRDDSVSFISWLKCVPVDVAIHGHDRHPFASCAVWVCLDTNGSMAKCTIAIHVVLRVRKGGSSLGLLLAANGHRVECWCSHGLGI